MQTQQQLNYERIASAIRFIKENRREQPKLEEVAEHVHMSPYHFQRTFQEFSNGHFRNTAPNICQPNLPSVPFPIIWQLLPCGSCE